MKKDLVELVFILDRSGSMAGLESDTIGGFNSLIEKQKKEVGEAVVTTVLFDDKIELLHDRINIKGVKNITEKEYFVRGTTALLDAIGISLNKTLNAFKNTSEEERPEKVMFIITTDGLENASSEYSYKKIKELISIAKKDYSWEFIFLGANIDAETEAGKFGIDREMAVDYRSDKTGTRLNYEVMSDAISSVRKSKKMEKNWRSRIDEHFKS